MTCCCKYADKTSNTFCIRPNHSNLSNLICICQISCQNSYQTMFCQIIQICQIWFVFVKSVVKSVSKPFSVESFKCICLISFVFVNPFFAEPFHPICICSTSLFNHTTFCSVELLFKHVLYYHFCRTKCKMILNLSNHFLKTNCLKDVLSILYSSNTICCSFVKYALHLSNRLLNILSNGLCICQTIVQTNFQIRSVK